MKKNKFIYRKLKRFKNDCYTFIRINSNESEDNLMNFNNAIKIIYDFTIENFNVIYNKGLKYPTTYFIERLKHLHKNRNENSLIIMFEDVYNIIDIYSSLFTKPRHELINHYYNEILLYQYDQRLCLHQYDINSNNYSECNHHFLIDLDYIADKFGVYKLYDNNQLVYVGKSYTLGLRIQASLKERKCNYYSYCLLDSKELTNLYETYYISKLKPKYNIKDIDVDISEFNLEELAFSNIKSNYPLCVDMKAIEEKRIALKEYFMNLKPVEEIYK